MVNNKFMLKFLEKIIDKIENSPTSFCLWSVSFLSIIATRVLMENWLSGMVNKTGDYFFHHFSYTLVFFLLSYVIFVLFLMKFLKINLKKISNVILWGYLIIILPPLIDFVMLQDKYYLSFYGIYGLAEIPKRFITFFGDSPDFGITYGVRFEIAFTVLALLVYGYIKTKSKIKALSLGIISYAILFFLGTFPSWFTIITQGFKKGFLKIGEIEITQLFFTSAKFFSRNTGTYLNALSIKLSIVYAVLLSIVISAALFFYYRKELIAFLKNSRPVQLIYHIGLLAIGMLMGIFFTKIDWDFNIFNFFALMAVATAVVCAWLASVVVNDIYDKKIDAVTNQYRPLVVGIFSEKNYIIIGAVLFAVSIFFSAMVNPKAAFLLIAYQGLAFLYSAWPFRLKRFLGVATLVSSLASLLVLFIGFILVVPEENLSNIPARIVWLLGIALIFSLPIKDLKDIKGDKLEEVKTVPVVFGEYWGKMIIGSGIFLAYVFSVILANEFQLMFWALLFGGASFWILNLSNQNKKITNRNLIWWVMGILFLYFLIVIVTLAG